MKIEITIQETEEKSCRYIVSQGDRYTEELAFHEMLGLIASLTAPEEKKFLNWMRTDAGWKELRSRLAKLHVSNEAEAPN